MRPFTRPIEILRNAGLRPTRQRLALAKLLFEGGDKHVTAEILHIEANKAGTIMSLATVYNTLHQFRKSGLLREVTVDGQRTYFDTNLSDHHHFYFPDSGTLVDIPAGDVAISQLPDTPQGSEIEAVNVIIRLKPAE